MPGVLLLLLLQETSGPLQDPSEKAKEALKRLEEIEADDRALQEILGEAEKLRLEYRSARDSGRFDRAEEIRKGMEGLRDRYERLWEGLKKKLARLIEDATRGIKEAPEDWGLLSARGQAYAIEGRYKQAAEDLARSLKLRPGQSKLELKLAEVLLARNDYAEALRRVEALLEREPDHARARLLAGICEFSLNRFRAASDRLGKLLDVSEVAETAKAFKEAADRCAELWKQEEALRKKEAEADDLPRVRLVTSKGEIVVELFENEAPNTVANFVFLVEQGFYDGTRFHRVVPNFMVQGGDPNSKNDDPEDDGRGGPGYRIADECRKEPFRRHFRGSLSMANAGPDTNGSQFFLTHAPAPWLNGRHTVFGRVIRGQEVVDSIEVGDVLKKAEVLRKRDHPYKPQKLE